MGGDKDQMGKERVVKVGRDKVVCEDLKYWWGSEVRMRWGSEDMR